MYTTKNIFSIIVVVVFLTMLVLFILGAFKGEVMALLNATIHTLLRLFISYIISLVLAIIFGMYCAFDRNAARVWLPIIDVLQTVPILAFFPVAIELFLNTLGGARIAYELASIFLIFTTMYWNLFYGVYDSISTIPAGLQSFTRIFRIPFSYALKYIYIPVSIPNIVSNSIISWANGWYFVVLNEYIFYEAKFSPNQGLGIFIYNAFAEGNIRNTIIAILWITSIIVIVHIFIWEKLLLLSSRFKIGSISEGNLIKNVETKRKSVSRIRLAIDFLHKFYRHLIFIPFVVKIPKIPKIHFIHFPHPKDLTKKIAIKVCKYIAILLPLILTIFILVFLIIQMQTLKLDYVLESTKGLFLSSLRVILSVIFCVTIAFFLNQILRKNTLLEATLVPIMQMISAIPVSILMPLVFFFTLNTLKFAEIGRFFILISTTFWYVFFNIYAGFKRLPNEYEVLADIYKIKGILGFMKIYMPWILSSLLIGIHTGQGACWNAIIIVEYVDFGGTVYKADGIGGNLMYNYFSTKHMAKFSFDLLLLTAIIIIYSFMFKKLLNFVENRYKYEY